MASGLDDKIEFKQLCDILENVAKARGSKKVHIVQTFFDDCRNIGNTLKAGCPLSGVSLYPILRLILPDLERQRGPYNLKQISLANLYARIYCFAKNSDNYNKLINYREPTFGKVLGKDFADRAYWVLNKRLPRTVTHKLTIARVNKFLNDISRKDATTRQKIETFRVLFRQITGFEMKWLTRIILKDLRLGIGKEGILHAYHQDANNLFLVTNNLHEICNRLHDPRTKVIGSIQIFSHFKPMLLERCRIEDAERLFRDNAMYYVQSKYDGERSQLHMKNGKFKYYTRQGYDITKNPGFGETESSGFLSDAFTRCLNAKCFSFVLDGELMGWHKEKKMFGTKGMNFDVKNLSASSRHQPCFVTFDIILHNDVLLIDTPYKDRLKLLRNIFVEKEGSLVICPSTLISNREELIDEFNVCCRNNEEGIVLKEHNMKYRPNAREGSGCYKFKAEYSDNLVQDIDLIILGGYYGDGKYTGLIKSFMTGVASSAIGEECMPSQFLSVVSVSTGIGDEMLRDLQEKFAPHWMKERPRCIAGPKKNQPDVWIHPEHSTILTIRATEIVRSNEYPSGYTLRFPRVVLNRVDKPWYSPCTVSELLSLVKDGSAIHKLVKREATLHDVVQVPAFKLRKIPLRSKPIEHNVCNVSVIPLTRLLEGKEICVINGNNESTKDQIEILLLQHSAKIVQNPMKTTFCAIVGNSKTIRGESIANSKIYDVVTLDWLKRVTDRCNWASLSDFLPWELLCRQRITAHRLAQSYDEYYDHFTLDADEKSLERSFDKITKSLANDRLTVEQEKEINEELFGEDTSPYSPFRDITGYFVNESNCTKWKFRFMSGTVKDNIDNSVTHIFTRDNKVEDGASFRIHEQIVVKSTWIDDSFRNGGIACDMEDYLVELNG